MERRVPALIVSAGSESVAVRGRQAALISIILRNGARIDTIPVGQLILSFADGQVKGEIRESLPSAKVD